MATCCPCARLFTLPRCVQAHSVKWMHASRRRSVARTNSTSSLVGGASYVVRTTRITLAPQQQPTVADALVMRRAAACAA
jgi:hypothetical protein